MKPKPSATSQRALIAYLLAGGAIVLFGAASTAMLQPFGELGPPQYGEIEALRARAHLRHPSAINVRPAAIVENTIAAIVR